MWVEYDPPLFVYRRIGGLEIKDIPPQSMPVVYRRIGGLENCAVCYQYAIFVYRRIGGLEKTARGGEVMG